jgi:long-chain acyl-CoA synthetase
MTASLIIGNLERTCAELDARAALLAGGWAAEGLTEGDVVAVLLRNEAVYADIILACRLAGIYYCPLNWHLAPSEIAFILQDCGARMLIGNGDLVQAALDDMSSGLRVLLAGPDYEDWLAAQSPYAGPTVAPRGHMAYTSGTTGRPKGIRRSPVAASDLQASREIAAALVRDTMGLVSGCRALMPAPLYHSAPSVFAQNALQLCESFVLMPRFDAEETLALIEQHRINTIYLVPVMYSRLLTLPAATRALYDLSSLRYVASTGAPCAPDVKRAMIDWFGPIVHETYASSEAGMITVISAEEASARPGSAGRPAGKASIRIMTEDGELCPTGQIGLIYVRQPAYPDFTYNKQPQARAAIERDGHITLGDMGYLDEDGYLFVCDRASDMVISGGVNVYPAEIEHVLMRQVEVLDCAVFGIPDVEFGERLHALIQLAPGALLSEHDLIARLRGEIAGFKIPRSIEFVENLRRDANGKLAKRHLRAPYWEAAGRRI